MANEIEKVNSIAIGDIEKVSSRTDDNIQAINSLEFTGSSPYTAHVFTSTGELNVSSGGEAQILVVGGGGSAGVSNTSSYDDPAGAGGAGGFRVLSMTLADSTYYKAVVGGEEATSSFQVLSGGSGSPASGYATAHTDSAGNSLSGGNEYTNAEGGGKGVMVLAVMAVALEVVEDFGKVQQLEHKLLVVELVLFQKHRDIPVGMLTDYLPLGVQEVVVEQQKPVIRTGMVVVGVD